MRYHARKRRGPDDDPSDPELFRDIIPSAYRYHDLMLGRLMQIAGPDCAVMVVSDHGFHSDSLLPSRIPAEAAGPAVEHREFGIFCLRAPGVRQNERIYGASVLDIAPTILHLFGFPAGADMDGKVLVNAFTDRTLPTRIPSWDTVDGDDGRHPLERHYDGAASVESLKQLVDLGYVAPQPGDTAAAVRDCLTENRYNLARAHLDAGDLAAAEAILDSLIDDDKSQIRYYQHLFQCLLVQHRYEDCARILDSLDGFCPDMARCAAADLKERRAKTPDLDVLNAGESEARREMFERRQLAEKLGAFVTERILMRCSLLLARGCPEDKEAARPLLDHLASRRMLRRLLAMFFAESYERLGERERALEFTRRARRADRDNWRAIGLEARIHYRAGRYVAARDRAIESLALVFLQPTLHHLLGLSFVRLGEIELAEQEFRVALAQAPGMVIAHESLATLLRRDPSRLGEASVHMAQAEALRQQPKVLPTLPTASVSSSARVPVFERAAFAPPTDRSQMITVVGGLPRSGTSMMMLMLAKGGIEPFTDMMREPDLDNPKGYFEHERSIHLHQNAAWLSEVRGKAIKIVVPLLPYLPADQQYRLIFMHRSLDEVVASQRAMLLRLGRPGANLNDQELMRAYISQLVRVQTWLARRSEIPVLAVAYTDAISEPDKVATRLSEFLGVPFDVGAAASAADPSLRRQGRSAET